ncbi:glycosyltransferase family 4 protein [Paracraurococcus lichenis]|uniref:Glycosyltransferase family 1 protein n=1 Tax=Paracraurococcus lichenis TaxID=3064888 RepID=A0ABT9E761_9PROT|nr:glycosyltransferase family 1 protein [Paracraurococcus sp. LOR1-02]MDO9711999.1 glycosyltransferase family 1 protein [Paracraurococcus sp. LOR1-02]
MHRISPSGIDRVEMAYARRWLDRPEHEATFAAQSLWGWFAALPRDRVAALLDALEEVWEHGAPTGGGLRRAQRIAIALQVGLAHGRGRAALLRRIRGTRNPVFLLVSHRALDRHAPIAALRRAGARFVPLIHDLIPLTHPEYTRAPQIGRHAARIATVAELADGIIVNSTATESTLVRHLLPHGRALPPIAVAPLGIRPLARPAADLPTEPYFVCLGTVEPRKNHHLLLHLWRELAVESRDGPRLLLCGRRGWENENVLDLLERCDALRGLVFEMGSLPDREVTALLAGARALLFPTFAEGYGLPLAEALALGVPAICSDLPALREVGGDVPDYLAPLDGLGWRRAILDYASPDSPARAAQLARLRQWQRPGWDAHFAAVDALLDRVTGAPVRGRRPIPAREPQLAASAPLGATPA